jgi:hypothetical protein
MKQKARPDHLSVSDIYIDRNDQSMIATIVVRPNHDDNFLSRS